MTSGHDQVFGFRAAIERNRQTFILQHAFALHAFFVLCERFDRAGRRLQTGRNKNGKSLISLAPFLLLAQRQSINGFEEFSTFRSYDGWMLLRPAVEAGLIMGKWVDNPENAAIWSARVTRRTEYIKTFTGKGLISEHLPRASEIKSVLDRLNDEFVHANEPYYHRHTRVEEAGPDQVSLRVDYFDNDSDAESHTVGFLHLIAVLIDSVDAMLARVFRLLDPMCRVRRSSATGWWSARHACVHAHLSMTPYSLSSDCGLRSRQNPARTPAV